MSIWGSHDKVRSTVKVILVGPIYPPPPALNTTAEKVKYVCDVLKDIL